MSAKIIVNHKGRFNLSPVDEKSFARIVSAAAIKKKDWVMRCEVGGSIDDDYSGTVTECALGVSDPDGSTVIWIGRCKNAASERTVAERCLAEAAAILDYRCKQKTRDNAWRRLKRIHASKWTPLERLAAVVTDD